MLARGQKTIRRALLTLALFLLTASLAGAWDQHYRYPVKVRVSGSDFSDPRTGTFGVASRDAMSAWEAAAGASRGEILCPRRGYDFAIGMRPFFSNLSGMVKALSKGGEGTFLNLHGHLRVPAEATLWEMYAHLRLWDKVNVRLGYLPWNWGGAGHAATAGDFAGVLFDQDELIETNLNITTFKIGADYDVSYSRDLIFGPNADFHIIRWSQRVNKATSGENVDFTQTLLQPSIGAHVRYEPRNTGYFSWFKPYLEGRFSWMSFSGLGLSTWDLGAGVAPPLSRNVDAGMKVGYKQWKIDGNRSRLFADVAVEGLYFDLSLRF